MEKTQNSRKNFKDPVQFQKLSRVKVSKLQREAKIHINIPMYEHIYAHAARIYQHVRTAFFGGYFCNYFAHNVVYSGLYAV